MTGTIFWRSIGIGLGFGFSVAVFYWLTIDLPPETQGDSKTNPGYASLDELARAWAYAPEDFITKPPNGQNNFDQLNEARSTWIDDPIWVHSVVGVDENSNAVDSQLELPGKADMLVLNDSKVDGDAQSLSSLPSTENVTPSNLTDELELGDKKIEPDAVAMQISLLSSQSREEPSSLDLSADVAQNSGRNFLPIRSNEIHANPFFDGSHSQQNFANRSAPAASIQHADAPSQKSSINEDDKFNFKWGSDSPVRSKTPDESLERAASQPFGFTHSNSASPPMAESVLLTDPEVSIGSEARSWQGANLALSESAALRAVHHIEYGKTLARRGALATAEREFHAALAVLARDFDSRSGKNEHSQSLGQGILALKEAADFDAGHLASQIDLDVAGICESHQSGALTPKLAKQLSAIQALQQYLSYAQFQIEQGAGRNVVAAEALYCLGKLRTMSPPAGNRDGNLNAAHAIVFHRAALAGDPNNYRSAHELGVLMAHLGELYQAKELFRQSLRIQPTPKTWENLAKLHLRMNEPELAQLAQVEQQKTIEVQTSGPIRWVDSPQFQAQALPEILPPQLVNHSAAPTGNGYGNQGVRQADARTDTQDEKRKTWTDRLKFW